MTALNSKRPAAIRLVIPFVFRHWLDQPLRADRPSLPDFSARQRLTCSCRFSRGIWSMR